MIPTPIETQYGGCRFRSRLEARWAVFFDALGVRWEYEREGYDLDGIWYLPDFWLPQFETWVEIKGQAPDDDAWRKLMRLVRQTGKAGFMFWGAIGSDMSGALVLPCADEDPGNFPAVIDSPQHLAQRERQLCWAICPLCGYLSFTISPDSRSRLHVMCGSCFRRRVRPYAKLDRCDPRRHPAIEDAYTSARSARFA